MVAEVFERDLHLIRDGVGARIELPTQAEPLAGHVESIGAVLEGSTRTAPVRIRLDDAAEQIRPGMFGRVRIESPDRALSLPTSAVLVKDRRFVVYVQLRPGVFERREVTVGPPVEGRVLVRSGVVPEERVVVRGALLLDGAADQLI